MRSLAFGDLAFGLVLAPGLCFEAGGLSRPKSVACLDRLEASLCSFLAIPGHVPGWPSRAILLDDQYSLSISTGLGDTKLEVEVARRHKYSYGRNYSRYQYANDNYRPRPRLVYSSPTVFQPRVVARGFRFPKVAFLLAGSKARQRYLDGLVRAVEDRRRFDPRRSLAPPGALVRAARALGVGPSPQYSSDPGRFPAGISFAMPDKVAICVRRRIRREVLFAKGRGGGGNRPPRRNYWSDVQC